MPTILLVHGTGVREPAFTGMLHHVEREIRSRRDDIMIAPCYWGETCGTRLGRNGDSIPQYDTTRSIDDAEPGDYQAGLWGILYQDPLFELRTLALGSSTTRAFVPGRESEGEEIGEMAQAAISSDQVRALVEQGGVGDLFDDAGRAVLASEPCHGALQTERTAELRSAIARAITAATLMAARESGLVPLLAIDPELRDRLVITIVDKLGGGERSIGGWVARQAKGLVLRAVTSHLRRRRGAITDASYPAAGDILRYQARCEDIQQFIREKVMELESPVVILAHSLGGIASVEMLIAAPLPQVQLLVTVGSQMPFLYEIDALHQIRTGDPLPEHFPRWLNIYDPRDILSYIGEKLFPGKVHDICVDNRQPFPESHGAYWANPVVWDEILANIS